MKILLTDIQREWAERLYHALLFAFLFTIFGFLIPITYYRYFDFRQYIKVDPVAYNKKVFAPCEPYKSITHYYSSIDTPVEFNYRLYKVVDHHIEQVKQIGKNKVGNMVIHTFVNKTDMKGIILADDGKIPCDFPEGTFYIEGIIAYYVKGELHTAPYRSQLVSVEATPSADLEK